jgi:hypothetical protein
MFPLYIALRPVGLAAALLLALVCGIAAARRAGTLLPLLWAFGGSVPGVAVGTTLLGAVFGALGYTLEGGGPFAGLGMMILGFALGGALGGAAGARLALLVWRHASLGDQLLIGFSLAGSAALLITELLLPG